MTEPTSNSKPPTKSVPLKADHILLKTLTSLMMLEAKESLTPEELTEHRAKTKQILESLIAKLENNYEYETYLEAEIAQVEARCYELQTESDERITLEKAKSEAITQEYEAQISILTHEHGAQMESIQSELTSQRELNEQLMIRISEQNKQIKETLRYVKNKVNSLNHNFVGDQNVPFIPE